MPHLLHTCRNSRHELLTRSSRKYFSIIKIPLLHLLAARHLMDSCCHKLSTFTKINLGGRWRELSFPDSEAQIPPCLGRRENSILLIIISVEIDVTSSLSSSSSSSELRSWLKNVGNSVSCFLNMPPSKCQLSWVCHWTSPQCRIIRDRLLRPLTLANATPGFCLALRCSAREKHV